jgi:hypothetical protein
MSSIFGNLTPNTLNSPLMTDKRLAREQLLNQSKGEDFFQAAIVLEIDPVGGLFGSNEEGQVGSPRFSIRARILNQTAEGGNSDILNNSDELPVYFPFEPNYHEYNPIKVGEKVWVFELSGLEGTAQRYWKSRVNSPTALNLGEFVRPTNNYSNASYEANLGRRQDTPEFDVNTDRRNADTVEKVAINNPDIFGDIDFPDGARSNFSRVMQETALRYGFVNEAFPEWFYRPSDKVSQGSNNSGILFGTNMFTIETEDDFVEDIADLLSIFGASNDASDFSNATDAEVMVQDRSLISVNAKEKTALAILVSGRKSYFNSFTFDATTIATFENFAIDNIPAFANALELIGGVAQGESPSALIRSSNIRLWGRDTIVIGLDTGNGIFMTKEEDSNIISKFDGGFEFLSKGTSFLLNEEEVSFSLGTVAANLTTSDISLSSGASLFSLDAATAKVAATTFDLSSVGTISFPSTIQTSSPMTFSSAASFGSSVIPVANKTTLDGLAAAINAAAANPALTAAVPAGPVVAAALVQIASSITSLSYSQNLKG